MRLAELSLFLCGRSCCCRSAKACAACTTMASSMPSTPLCLCPTAAGAASTCLPITPCYTRSHTCSQSYRGVCLCSLKADNVLLDTCLNVCDTQWRGIAKVADLGLSTVVDPYTGLVAEQMSCGTLPYMAPELFQGSPVSQAVDAYAFGMLMWELFHQVQPHTGMSPLHVKAAMTFGSMLSRCSLAMEASYKAIMLACWESQPCMRPTMAMLEELPQLLL